MSSQRLQKVLAQAGIASRRAAEHLITEGRVRVNGRIVRELGARANPDRDRVEVDGRRLVAQRHVYFLMHKPREVVTTLDDPEGRKTVKDLLRDINERVFPVGRLDFQTSGALLLTNDGDLAQALLHPTRAVPKTYNAKLEGEVDAARLEQLRDGVVLDDGKKTAPAEVNIIRKDAKATSLEITISEGKNRQIHRMGEAIHRTVLRLTRISFAGLTIEGLRAGQMRQLSAQEVSELKQAYQHKPKRRGPFKAYGATELDEAGPLFAVAGDGDDNEFVQPAAWPEPEQRGSAGPRKGGARDENASRHRRSAGDDRAQRTTRGSRDSGGGGAKPDPRDRFTRQDARDDRTKRDPRDGFAKRDPRDGFAKRDPRDGFAKRDPRDDMARRDPRDARAKRDPLDARAKRDPLDARAKRDPRDGFAKRDPRDGFAKRERARPDPRAARTKYDGPAKRDPRDDKARRDPRDARAKRDVRGKPDPRAARTKYDPRSKRDPRVDQDQAISTELEPRKTRTQPSKRTRSQSSATKRGPAPRKTRFKR